VEACASVHCGRAVSDDAAQQLFAAEDKLQQAWPAAQRGMQVAAGNVRSALEARNGPAMENAIQAAMKALTQTVDAVKGSPQVSPKHYCLTELAKSAAALRAVLGDSLAASGHQDHAKDMWKRAAGELQEAVAAQQAAFPLPRDGHIADLIGLAGLYRRLDRNEEARRCLSDALDEMNAVYWSCEPAGREASQAMMQGVKAALAEM